MPVLERPQIDTKKEKEIHHEAIAKLEQPFEKILERIGSENFDLIIGDDASGRIPTLILSKFFKAKAEKEDRKSPQTIFIAGGTRNLFNDERKTIIKERKARINQLLEKIIGGTGDEIRPRVLIVTDTISTGDTLQPLIEALKEHGVSIQVAAVTAIVESAAEHLQKRFGINIAYGGLNLPEIWGKHNLGGIVRQENNSEIHSRPIKKPMPPTEEPTPEARKIQKTINLSREDADIIADRLIEKFEEN
ncbi:MAG: hypothetical protein HYT65_03205 [Candidatus Yanofskybacteria bacterium]|nr:hypothetical protein [Candidatus Yanofskybacteria bacterium]